MHQTKPRATIPEPERAAALPGPGASAGLSAEERCARQEREIEGLCREVLERYEEATFVYRLSERIGSLLDEAAMARLVLQDAITVLGADGGEVWLKAGGGLRRVAAVPESEPRPPAPSVVNVAATCRPWVPDDEHGQGAAIAVPLPDGPGLSLGVITLKGRPGNRTYRTGEIRLLCAVAALTSAFIRNVRLGAAARRADARRREDEIARQVHRGLLPRHDPPFAGIEVSGGFRAADLVGGDYYGYVPMADGSLGIAIADVAGHGVASALFMATAKGALESIARMETSPAEILSRVNGVLASDLADADLFTTLFFASVRPGGRRFAWASAGHNPPLLMRASGEREMLSSRGPALGIVGDASWEDAETDLRPGDILVLYTDGLVEARDDTRQFFGIDRIAEAARRPAGSASEIRERVLTDLARHTGPVAPHDDRTLVVIRCVETKETT